MGKGILKHRIDCARMLTNITKTNIVDNIKHFHEILGQSRGALEEHAWDLDHLKKISKRYKHDKARVIWDFLLWAYDNGYLLVKDGKHGDDLALVQKSLDERKRGFKKFKYEEVGQPAEIKFIEKVAKSLLPKKKKI